MQITTRFWLPITTAFFLVVGSVLSAAAQANLPDFTALIEKHSPAVVKITATSKANRHTIERQLPPEAQGLPDVFRELLERRQMPRDRGSMGSGFIISHDGYVLTNDHVIENMDTINVILSDQREFTATLVGRDKRSDLALLKIEGSDLPILTLAKNENLKVGQWVIAIGSPFGLDYSATAGIVSAIGRSIPSAHAATNYVPFIQTDVAINPGNSGGPLFNLNGEVVGINSQIYSPSGGSVGLSFAIPSSLAIDVVDQLKAKGRVERGWLGVEIQSVNRDLAKSLGLSKATGALVNDVVADSPAEKGGLKAGDVITRFNGQAVNASEDLPYLVGRTPANTKVNVDIMREGKQRTIKLTIGALPVSDDELASTTSSVGGANQVDALGLVVSAMDVPVAGVDSGVVVREVKPNSPAAEAGVQVGDVITQLAFKPIKTPADYQKVAKSLSKGEPHAMRFYRQGRSVFRAITIK